MPKQDFYCFQASTNNNSDETNAMIELELCKSLILGLSADSLTDQLKNEPDITTNYFVNSSKNTMIINNYPKMNPNFVVHSKYIGTDSQYIADDYSWNFTLLDTNDSWITIDPTQSIKDSIIEVATETNAGPFYPFGENHDDHIWSATFDDSDPNVNVSLAINSGLNYSESITKNISALSVTEDVSFNKKHAFGANHSEYFKKTNGKGLNIETIDKKYDISTNGINITIDKDKITDFNNFGTYKIECLSNTVTVPKLDDPAPFYITHYPNNFQSLTDIKTPEDLKNLFGNDFSSDKYPTDACGNWKFQIEMYPDPDISSGYIPSINDNIFSINNDNLVRNLEYMKSGCADLSHVMVIHQSPLIITNNDGGDIPRFILSSSGETFDSTLYNKDGVIRMYCDASDQRFEYYNNELDIDTRVVYESDGYTSLTAIKGKQRTEYQVEYSVNVAIPSTNSSNTYTTTNDYKILNKNDVTLITPATFDVTNFSTTISQTDLSNNYVTLIQIQPNSLHFADVLLYDKDNAAVKDIKADIWLNNVEQYDKYRLKLTPKTIKDLSINYDDKAWQFLTSDNNKTVSADATAFLTAANVDIYCFPDSPNIAYLINNSNESLDIDITLESINKHNTPSSNELERCVSIQWTDYYGNSHTEKIEQSSENSKIIDHEESATTTTTAIDVLYKGKPIKVNKIVKTSTFTSQINIQLAGFKNLWLQTPKLKSIQTHYEEREKRNTVHISDCRMIDGFTKLLATETITYYDNSPGLVKFTMTINGDSVSVMKGELQGSNDGNVWISISQLSENLDLWERSIITSSINSTSSYSMQFHTADLGVNLLDVVFSNDNYTSNVLQHSDGIPEPNVKGYYWDSNNIKDIIVDDNGLPQSNSGIELVEDNITVVPTDGVVTVNYKGHNIASYDLPDGNVNLASLLYVPYPIIDVKSNINDNFNFIQLKDITSFVEIDTGVYVKFNNLNVSKGDNTSFYLKSDKFSVYMAGVPENYDYEKTNDDYFDYMSDFLSFQYFDGMTYVSTQEYYYSVFDENNDIIPNVSEMLTVPYYRGGYHYNSKGIATYTIDRSGNLTAAALNICDDNNDVRAVADFQEIYSGNDNMDVSFFTLAQEPIGSIGNLLTFNFSRIPGILVDELYLNEINVNPDKYSITNIFEETKEEGNVSKATGVLYNNNNGLIINSTMIHTNSHQFWTFAYNLNDINIYHSYSSTDGNPHDLDNFQPIETILNDNGKKTIDYTGINESGPFAIDYTNIKLNTTSYFVVAPPQLIFKTIKDIKVVPYNDLQFKDEDIVTQYVDATNDIYTSYYPFTYDPSLNDIAFMRSYERPYSAYIDDPDDKTYQFKIDGARVIVSEIFTDDPNNMAITEYGAIIFDPATNNIDDKGVCTIHHYQLPNNSAGDIVIKISNPFVIGITDSVSTYSTNKSNMEIIGVDVLPPKDSPNNLYNIELFKLDCGVTDLTVINTLPLYPKTRSFVSIPLENFPPINLSLHESYSFKTKLSESANSLTAAFLTNGWSTQEEFNIENFTFNFTALTTTGKNLINKTASNTNTSLLASPQVKHLYTYITRPHVASDEYPDGTPEYVIDADYFTHNSPHK